MRVRPMNAADIPAVDLLDHLSFSQPWPAGAFEVELANKRARCWVTEVPAPQGNEQPGLVIAALVCWLVLDEAHIATIAVHPDYRNQGIGKQLLQTGMQAAFAEGARIFHLEVRAGNLAAQKMYENFGFEIVGRRQKYYKDNSEDALLMSLDLRNHGISQ